MCVCVWVCTCGRESVRLSVCLCLCVRLFVYLRKKIRYRKIIALAGERPADLVCVGLFCLADEKKYFGNKVTPRGNRTPIEWQQGLLTTAPSAASALQNGNLDMWLIKKKKDFGKKIAPRGNRTSVARIVCAILSVIIRFNLHVRLKVTLAMQLF